MTDNKYQKETRLVRSGMDPWDNEGIPNPPVYHASTILKQSNTEHLESKSKYDYGRTGTPTSNSLQIALAELYGMDGSVLTSSGLAAITTATLAFVSSGAHLLASHSIYQSGRRYLTETLPKFGVEVEFFPPRITPQELKKLIRPETALIHFESPGSMTFELHDLPALTAVARSAGVPTMLDNTWATALGLDCVEMGVDVVVEALTKYVGGHSDLMMGAIVANGPFLDKVKYEAFQLGQCSGPDDIYLATRGLRSLHLRLDRSMQSSLQIAEWLSEQPEVSTVIHPARKDHPDHMIYQRDFKGGAGLFCFELKNQPQHSIDRLIDSLELFGIGSSWGGFESLIQQGRINEHRSFDYPIGPLIRVAVGAENPDDLINDLKQAFDAIREKSA